MFLDDEINVWWCLRDTWRCDAAEAIGIWAVLLLCATVICTTVVHSFIQHMDGSEWRNEEATRRHLTANDDDVGMVCALLVYFFVFTAGCFAWVAGGVRWVHPFQLWQLQVLGAVGLVAPCFLLWRMSTWARIGLQSQSKGGRRGTVSSQMASSPGRGIPCTPSFYGPASALC
jgi:hypothetical protein